MFDSSEIYEKNMLYSSVNLPEGIVCNIQRFIMNLGKTIKYQPFGNGFYGINQGIYGINQSNTIYPIHDDLGDGLLLFCIYHHIYHH